jgi:hypothetical protein
MMTKKSTAPAEAFIVPSLAEVDDVYGGLVAKRSELNTASSDARAARRAAERELEADESREIRPGVAELLGDGPSAKSTKREAVAAARQREIDINAALTVVELRLRDAKTAAVRAATACVRPEWDRRTKALCDALKVADAAHRDLWALRHELEAGDVPPTQFGAWPYFLGASDDEKIANYLREVGHHA